MTTEKIAKEIVELKNQIQALEKTGRGDSESAKVLRDRKLVLQNRLADDTDVSDATEPDSQADKVQFIPPS